MDSIPKPRNTRNTRKSRQRVSVFHFRVFRVFRSSDWPPLVLGTPGSEFGFRVCPLDGACMGSDVGWSLIGITGDGLAFYRLAAYIKVADMVRLLETLERRSRPFLILAGLGVLVVIGIIDYLTGYEMLFSVFYLLEVGLAAWFVGKGFGLVMSVLSVLVWIGGDLAAGARYSNPLIPVWNALILMVFYFIVVWLLTSLRSLHRELEATVRAADAGPARRRWRNASGWRRRFCGSASGNSAGLGTICMTACAST